MYVILTTNKDGGDKGGWEDKSSFKMFKGRLKIIMKGMSQSKVAAGYAVKEEEVDKLVEDKFQVRRSLNNDGHHYCHNKIVVVDRKIMYVGSDNAYPSYNEEHGVWIEHKATIDNWFTSFWDKYWDWSTVAQD